MASLPTQKSRNFMQAEAEKDSGEHDFSDITYNILADFCVTLKHAGKLESGIRKSKKRSSSNTRKLFCIAFACKN